MLTLTVMQHERGAIGQLSTEAPEAEDVLSRLRHLHHTLQECHWRVQLVDHTLCAQGDKGHHYPQTPTGNDPNFEIQARRDCSLQKQAKENYSHQLEIEKDCSPQNEAGNDRDLMELFRETLDPREPTEEGGCLKQPEIDQYCQNEVQKESEERHFFPSEEKLSVQVEDDIHDLHNNTNENLFNYSRGDSGLSNLTMNDHILYTYLKEEKHIHNANEEEIDIQNSSKHSCEFQSTDRLENKCNKYLARQECVDIVDDDSLPTGTVGTLSSTLGPSHVSKDPNEDEISLVPGTMTDMSEQYHQLNNLDVKLSEKILKQESSQRSHYIGELRYRPDSMPDLGNWIHYKEDKDFFKNQKRDSTTEDLQQKSKEMSDINYTDKVSPVEPSPEVAQRMDFIWEGLENLRSHFLALHSSLVDSSRLLCSQEFPESLDHSYSTTREIDKVLESNELHTMSEGFHHVTSETTQLHQAIHEQTFQRKPPFGNHPLCACHNLPRNQMSSHTQLEEQPSSTALSNNSTQTRTYLRGWQETFLCVVIAVLLLLLLLFLACCLLMVLPVVSVSVRTAGGLPAF